MQSHFEKLENVEKEKLSLSKIIENLQSKLITSEHNHKNELDRNHQMATILTQKEIELNEVSSLHLHIYVVSYQTLYFRTKMF